MQAEPQLQLPMPQPAQQNAPVDIYLLQQQLSNPVAQPQPFSILTSATNSLQLPNYFYNHLTNLYNVQTQHPVRNNKISEKNESSKPLKKEARTEQSFVAPVVQVFKDHKCSDDNHENISEELESDLKKSKELFAEMPSYQLRDVNGNFGSRNKNPFSYRGAVSFRVETPRPRSSNEIFYHTTEATTNTPLYSEASTVPVYNATKEGINRLVASTQDLITNEDLLRINNAIEHHMRVQNDDLIKPRPRFLLRNQNKNNQETLDVSPTTITVRAKIANILRGEIQHMENNLVSEQVLQSDSQQYKFSSPIVVAETPDNTFSKQVFDNVVSTVVPYLENGYEVTDIKNGQRENEYTTMTGNSEDDFVNVTPRPISNNFLAPITVALRLLNSNDNDTFNYIEDHEAAESELVSDTVEIPKKEKTLVEVQESIPLAITHINDVEYHQTYMDEGRSIQNNKDAYEFARNLYDNYVNSVRSSKKIQDNLNSILLYKFRTANSQENTDNTYNENNSSNEAKEQLDTSENIQSHVEIRPNGENNQRSEQVYYNEDDYRSDNQKIIQPIIIEREVPVTKFVDRYIEKQVPYPDTVTVPVPVDRLVPYAVEVEKVVEKPVHVTKYIDKPYPVEIPRPYPVEVKIPYPVHQKVYVDRPVHVPYPVEKVVEKQVVHPVPIPTPVGFPVEVPFPVQQKVLYPFLIDRPVAVPVAVQTPVERIVQKEVPIPYAVEKRIPYPVPYETKVPVPYPVEKRVPVPIERIIEKPVTVTQIVEKPVHVQVPVPHPVPVHVHHPYPVERIVEKKVPYPVHVDRIVEKKVNVPYPVEKIVEKIVEKPVVVTKYVNKPYPVEVKVPYAVEKIVEKKVPYAVHVPVEVKVPYHVGNTNNYKVAYRYGYRPDAEETRNNLQYQIIDHDQLKNKQYQNLKAQYEQYMKDQKQKSRQQPVLIQSNQWGNQYASSYQYINNSNKDTRQQDLSKNQAYENYISYLTNSQPQNQYAQRQNQGQIQHNGHSQDQNQYNSQSQEQNINSQNKSQEQHSNERLRDYIQIRSQNHNYVDRNKNHSDLKVRRTDRVPKVTIEYGFKPPLIPSTEIDLNGVPINKSE